MKKILKSLPMLLVVCTLLILPTVAASASCSDTYDDSYSGSGQIFQNLFAQQQATCNSPSDENDSNCLIGNNCPAGSDCTADSDCPAGSDCTADGNCPEESNCTINTDNLTKQLMNKNSFFSFGGFDFSSILAYLGYGSNNNDTATYQNDQNTTESNISEYAQAVIALVNEERAKENLPALTFDATLTAAAEIRANEIMVSFSHTRPDGSSCFTALAETNATYTKAGENIAIGQSTPESVVEDWMNSPGHRANIMNTDYTRIGVAALPSTNSQYRGYAWTQFFAD